MKRELHIELLWGDVKERDILKYPIADLKETDGKLPDGLFWDRIGTSRESL